MRHKLEPRDIVPKFFSMVETQFNTKVKKFRSDNALELNFHDFFFAKGVVYQFSCVEIPEQNSMAKRKHQHLLSVARALLFQSRVPIQFWGDYILTVTFLINRTPTSLLKYQSLYQLLYHSPVDYSCFRVFDCLCFSLALLSHRSKIFLRAIVCIFLGYPHGVKGYKLYDIVTKKFIISWDVVFHEEVFPFHSIVPS